MADPPIGREFTITRVFDAPRELVWKAWTDPEHVARWFGPRGYSTPQSTVTMDVRPGGTFEFTTADVDDAATLVVYESSAEDGSRMNEVEIPLNVAP